MKPARQLGPAPTALRAADSQVANGPLKRSRGEVKVVAGTASAPVDNGDDNFAPVALDLDLSATRVLLVVAGGRDSHDQFSRPVGPSARAEARLVVSHFTSGGEIGGLGCGGAERRARGESGSDDIKGGLEHHFSDEVYFR